MTTEIARRAHLPAVTDEGFLEEVRTQIAPKASDSELRFFAQVVAKTQLDPWSRQVYLIPRWDGRLKREVHRPQVSIDGLRLVAERTGKYEGQTPVEWCGEDGVWKDVWLAKEFPRAARVGVYKSGRNVPTYAVAHWDEYVVLNKQGQPSGLWPTKGAVMISKCAEALALRKTFPQETSGLYTAEEMGHDAPAAPVLDQANDAPEPPAEVVQAVEVVSAEVLTHLREVFLASGKTNEDLAWCLLSVGVESLPANPSREDVGAAMRSLTLEQAFKVEALLTEKDDAVPGSGESA